MRGREEFSSSSGVDGARSPSLFSQSLPNSRHHTGETPMKNPMALTGRTIVVTGAGQGIGRAISQLVLDLDGNVVLVERNAETLAASASAMPADRSLAIEGNVAA